MVLVLSTVYGSHDVYNDVNSTSSLPVDVQRASNAEYLVFRLQTTANKLKNAYDGVDVSWIDSGTLAVLCMR